MAFDYFFACCNCIIGKPSNWAWTFYIWKSFFLQFKCCFFQIAHTCLCFVDNTYVLKLYKQNSLKSIWIFHYNFIFSSVLLPLRWLQQPFDFVFLSWSHICFFCYAFNIQNRALFKSGSVWVFKVKFKNVIFISFANFGFVFIIFNIQYKWNFNFNVSKKPSRAFAFSFFHFVFVILLFSPWNFDWNKNTV